MRLLKLHDICSEEYDPPKEGAEKGSQAYENVLDSLKVFQKDISETTGEWVIPEEEIKKRLDLRKTRIFTIDPITAKDLDDALSITHIKDDIYEIGVHIADVSYFVQ